MSLNNLKADAFKTAQKSGFHDNDYNPLKLISMLALLFQEVAEALEADREGNYCKASFNPFDDDFIDVDIMDDQEFNLFYINHVKGTFEEEIADIIIRALDICGFKSIDIDEYVKNKMRYNKIRKYKHGKKY